MVNAQTDTSNFIKPILIDKSVLSGVGLKKIDLKDEPEKDFYQKKLFGGDDISVFVVSTNSWNNKIDEYAFDEYVYLIHGQSIVKPKTGNAQIFNVGDHLFVPKGFEGEWEIRAGSNLHYELAVITSRRTDSTVTLENINHNGLSRSKLSGCQIVFENGKYEELLHKGVELEITLKAEIPDVKWAYKTAEKDKMIHILSGQLLITDQKDNAYIFYTGDFVVFPKGFRGNWKSEGHGMIKYLVVEKVD